MGKSEQPVPVEKDRKPSVKYSRKLCKRIFGLYLQGMSVLEISKLEGMPTANTIYEWKQREPWFREMMKGAKGQRADVFADKALSAAEAAVGLKDTPAERLRFDAYKWAAEVNDPTTYGKKLTHSGDKNNPIQFIVTTGFPEPNEHQRPPELESDGTIKKLAQLPPPLKKDSA